MFTSRAEYRLLFNHTSSELRYIPKLQIIDLVSEQRKQAILSKSSIINDWVQRIRTEKVRANDTFADLIKRGENENLLPGNFSKLHKETRSEILYRVKYEGYLLRELKNIERMKDSERIKIPRSFCYKGIPGLRNESAEKLSTIKPETLAQANRISGVNPSDISVLMILLAKSNTN
jgi:tRNA uridine 5-carboxymethylaminomethyl modification enzyme